MTVRTRFAPSPTGFLHIGGARTALFNWLYAKGRGGKFVLRVEDTDVARSTKESTDAILEGMSWLGLDSDEGPFFQSERFDLYREHAQKLLEGGLAYHCKCTPDELAERREAAKKEGRAPKYDGRCKNDPPSGDGPFALRFKIPPGKSIFKDLIKGAIAIENEEIEDFVILRSDNTPTYNLCVTVDDATMEINPVIRGDDHINNTPKQILLYEALGFPVPEFAHLPMILGSDKARLSKRHGATSVIAYRDEGYLPEALVNYLARLGWSSGDEEIFSLAELVEKFSLEHVGKSSGVFNPDKLLWLNQHYIKESTNERLGLLLAEQLTTMGIEASADERMANIAGTLKERAKTIREMAHGSRFFFEDLTGYDEKAERKFLNEEKAPLLASLVNALTALSDFTEADIEGVFDKLMEETGLKLGKLAQPVRVALTGGTVSPGIFETISVLGREKTLKRLEKALAHIETNKE